MSIPSNMAPLPGMMTVAQAARTAVVDEATIRRWVDRGLISHTRKDGLLCVDAAPIWAMHDTIELNQAARALKVGLPRLRKAVKAGHVEAVISPGGMYRVPKAALQHLAWLRPDVISRRDAAKLAGVHWRMIYAWARDGVLPYVLTPRGQQRYIRADVVAAMEQEADLLTPAQASAEFGMSVPALLELSVRVPVIGRVTGGGHARYSRSKLSEHLSYEG